MIKEAFDAGFEYGAALALQLIKQAQYDMYGATAINYPPNYWAQMYGMTPDAYYAAATQYPQQAPAPEAADEDNIEQIAAMYGMTPEQLYASMYGMTPGANMYGATSSYYPY